MTARHGAAGPGLRAGKGRRSIRATASEVVPGRREAESPEPITTAPGAMNSGLACYAREAGMTCTKNL